MNKWKDRVTELFMEENDKMALKELYKITNDELCNILIEWRDMEEMKSVHTNEYSMYEDIMSYLWKKYELGE